MATLDLESVPGPEHRAHVLPPTDSNSNAPFGAPLRFRDSTLLFHEFERECHYVVSLKRIQEQ